MPLGKSLTPLAIQKFCCWRGMGKFWWYVSGVCRMESLQKGLQTILQNMDLHQRWRWEWKEQSSVCSFKCMEECSGHTGVTTEGEYFLRGPPETGKMTFWVHCHLGNWSRSRTSHQPILGPPAPRSPVRSQMVDLGFMVLSEKEQPPKECASTHMFRNGLLSLSTLWASGGVLALPVSSRSPPIRHQPHRIKWLLACAENNLEMQKPPKARWFFQCFPTRVN